jgi:anti-sigma B factor antagonist
VSISIEGGYVRLVEDNSTDTQAMPVPFEVQDSVCGGRHTLVLSGELDIVSAPELEAMSRMLCADGISGVALDLSKLTFMDSTGLRAILSVKEISDSHGYEFMLIPGPHNVQRLFELTGLLDLLPFDETGVHAPAPWEMPSRRVLSGRSVPRSRRP